MATVETHEIVLSDTTKLSGLVLNGNNFYSPDNLDASTLSNSNLSSYTIDGATHTNGTLVVLDKDMTGAEGTIKSGTRFIIRDLSVQELKEIEINSKLEYLAAMADVEL